MCGSFFLALLAILFPPLPVWIKRGICSADSMINILLCILGFLPGLLHAWYIIAKYPEEPMHRYALVDAEQGHAHHHQGHHQGHGHGGATTVYVYTAEFPSAAAHSQPRYASHPHPQQRQQQQGGNKKQGQLMPGTSHQSYGTTSTNNNNGSDSNAGGAGGPQFLPSVTPATNGGEGASSSQQQPPSYNEAIKGDYKVQTHD